MTRRFWLGRLASRGRAPAVPLLVLLGRRLGDLEAVRVAAALRAETDLPRLTDAELTTAIGVAITRVTDELPTPADIEHVRCLLDQDGRRVVDAQT